MIKEGDVVTSKEAMKLALKEAKKGHGFVSPNPLVGCTIVDKNHNFLSVGAHLKFGEAHAEVNALNKIKDKTKLKGATVYVTLEPCAHSGKTGACAEALSQYPIKKIVYGTLDPNPLVAGKGLSILEKAGVEIGHYQTMEPRCVELCEQFLFHMKQKQPFVSIKIATSLDGKIALINGDSQWITSPESRLHSRNLRAHYDATMIGAGTFLNDNPHLDFRDTTFEGRKENRIVILDPKGKAAERFSGSHLEKKHKSQNIYVLSREENLSSWKGQSVNLIPWNNTPVGWEVSMKKLYEAGIYSLFVEGGAYAISQLLQFKRVQKLYLYQAPKILGYGKSWSDYYKIQSVSEALTLRKWESQALEHDRFNTGWF